MDIIKAKEVVAAAKEKMQKAIEYLESELILVR